MQKSTISWCERTWNPCTGCTKLSQGCKNCYAETIANRFWKDRKFTDIICHEDRLGQPLHIKKPSMIFVNSMSDLFHEKIPFEFILKVFNTIVSCIPDKHIFQILTKRPERALKFYEYMDEQYQGNFPDNVWLGVSAEDVHTFDERRFFLSQIPTAVKFISLEPLLGNINFDFSEVSKPDWIIVGGESGPHARPMKPDWVRNIRDQCKEYQIPLFFKQWGEFITGEQMPPEILALYDDTPFVVDQKGFYRCGKKKAGNLLDGIKYEEYPEGLK